MCKYNNFHIKCQYFSIKKEYLRIKKEYLRIRKKFVQWSLVDTTTPRAKEATRPTTYRREW